MRINLLFILIIFLFVPLSSYAQKTATVRSFTQTTDHIPGGERRSDLNGTPCALVKVQVVDNIERVEGNKIGDIVKKGVEKWVYMCKGSRNMRIHLKNHLPVKVMFQDYQINGLESNRVYELVIEIPNTTIDTLFNVPIQKQKLTINYSPETAMILVDSKSYKSNGHIELELSVGDHNYLIAANGYITAEGTVRLNERAPREITENLVPEKSGTQSFVRQKAETTVGNSDQYGYVNHTTSHSLSGKDDQYGQIDPLPSRNTVSKDNPQPKVLNKTFKYTFEGVTFKCKAKKGYITITEFDFNANNVTIPAQVTYEDNVYPVAEISTFINGNNYSATKLTIQEGIQKIDNYSFMEFRKLLEVSIPSSIKEIGKNAFRDNPSTVFYLPENINEHDLRGGRSIVIR